jgi:hypothetical protein
MRPFLKRLTVFLGTLVVGLGAAFAWLIPPHIQPPFSPASVTETSRTESLQIDYTRREVVKPVEEPAENPNPLDKIWAKERKLSYLGYEIKKECEQVGIFLNCKLKIRKNGKTLDKIAVEYSRDYWLKFGLFNFLGGKDKQLIIHTYSGGAHCCYAYFIYDLSPGFRKIYDSTRYDAANDIGNELFPVDIDNDGVYEFRRDVMAYDYFHASHADSVFPSAIFRI